MTKLGVAVLLSFRAVAWAAPAPQRGGGGRNGGTRQAGGGVASSTAVAAAAGTASATRAQTSAAANSGAGAGVATSSAASSGTGSGSGSSDISSSTSSGSGHDITVVNNCGGGHVEWKYNGGGVVQTISGTQHISGPVEAGIMWLQDYGGVTCSADGKDCGIVEFTLGVNDFNSINYSLLQEGLGNHDVNAPMYFTMQGPGCDKKAAGVCNSPEDCPTGYTGTDTMSGEPPTCQGSDGVGITVTFCP